MDTWLCQGAGREFLNIGQLAVKAVRLKASLRTMMDAIQSLKGASQ
jgi:hypothetical protein